MQKDYQGVAVEPSAVHISLCLDGEEWRKETKCWQYRTRYGGWRDAPAEFTRFLDKILDLENSIASQRDAVRGAVLLLNGADHSHPLAPIEDDNQ